jgi:hypothetical protein
VRFVVAAAPFMLAIMAVRARVQCGLLSDAFFNCGPRKQARDQSCAIATLRHFHRRACVMHIIIIIIAPLHVHVHVQPRQQVHLCTPHSHQQTPSESRTQ